MKNTNDKKPTHLGHRDRVRERYVKTGIDSLAEHEILELILFYSMPRVDTKPTAYKLISHFGNLENVLSASVDSLKNAGLTESCAIHLNLFTASQCWIKNNSISKTVLKDFNEIGDYLQEYQKNNSVETLIALLLDSQNRLLANVKISEGTFKNTKAELRILNKACVEKECAKVILSHNHPAGTLEPSVTDLSTTNIIDNFLSKLDITLVEHYIVTDSGYIGVKEYAKTHVGLDLFKL